MYTFITEIFFAGPTREIPNGQDVPSLPARVANLNTGSVFNLGRVFASFTQNVLF